MKKSPTVACWAAFYYICSIQICVSVHNRHWLPHRHTITINSGADDDDDDATSTSTEGYACMCVWNFFTGFGVSSRTTARFSHRNRWECTYFVSFTIFFSASSFLFVSFGGEWEAVFSLVSLERNTKCDILRCTQCPPYSCTHFMKTN